MHYAIGDIQGNLSAFRQLLQRLNFNPKQDYLYLLGDVVNRGNQSLETLLFIKELYDKDCADMVLGNHDFFLLMCAYTDIKPKKKDTITPILNSKHKTQLLDFLRTRPLLITHQNNILTHAGIPPQWDLTIAKQYAKEVERSLQRGIKKLTPYLKSVYQNQTTWQTGLSHTQQQCYTINALMRMRFCTTSGQLEFVYKNNQKTVPKGFNAWFNHPRESTENLIFGHWSSLLPQNEYTYPNGIYPMDTGCTWGWVFKCYLLRNTNNNEYLLLTNQYVGG